MYFCLRTYSFFLSFFLFFFISIYLFVLLSFLPPLAFWCFVNVCGGLISKKKLLNIKTSSGTVSVNRWVDFRLRQNRSRSLLTKANPAICSFGCG
ncbi:uncharacterized protein EURHEDRAFT_310370 [Aspergillus ruber CBS 135680]|uniref:Uncharacterized protein n=1 Tax=Aspergillus ruber (strain CBS 135680) TaxID=1388766 RepID=A0A017S2A9_ASPRC|nr:uncharacterized protein EURHEDRAFT_310370 [Aspergillus ruber CBS 135680]EYE90315.1 hypothetical protein EURHEDRAFT_310370 [Aspergillus ruber CBS 135680]